jgi:hypothetical protein
MTRSFEEVFEDHLELSKKEEWEEDMKRNFSEEIVILFENKIYHGHEGIKILATRLIKEIPKAKYHYNMILLDKELGMLEWTAHSEEYEVLDGVDSYLFRDGKIVGQTIHYTVTKRIKN